ncbi:MAG: HAD-IA family hydrolase [Clostridia bacterium]
MKKQAKAYQTVIFDLDGTLLNTLEDLTNATNHAMRESNYPEHSADEVRRYVGNGIGQLIHRALPPAADGDEEAFQEVLQAFKHYYALHNNDFTKPYEGCCDMLRTLASAGVKLAIVSNKNDPNVKALSAEYFREWIDVAFGEQEGIRRKPHPDVVLKVMKALGSKPEKTLYVGDSDVDLQTAQNAGVSCAAVCWGFRSEEELRAAGATLLVHSPEELVQVVLPTL